MHDINLAVETWKPVVGFEGCYEISSAGRVRSLDRQATEIRRGKPCVRTFKGKLLSPGVMASGHLFVMLGRGNGRLVHHLVLEAFIGPRPDGLECLHDNDIPDDNWFQNLRWGTRAENIEDAFRNGGRIRSQNPDPRVGKKRRGMAENILEFQAGREAAMRGDRRDKRRNADWLEGFDQVANEKEPKK